jgi:crotonobetainyl-CoA:carnitine CoA-transferase CaiB-like acyl-CoA transferase
MANRALEGIRVVELGPYVALPMTGRILASMGAEVIKVETNKVIDEMAFIPAWSRGAGQPDYQRHKKRITLDVRTDEGRDLLLQLLKVSDVFMTNFRRNILSRWGVDFPEVRAARPDIVNMWQTGLGGNGPYYTYKSYGILVQHMSGVSMMSGSPGAPPVAVNTSYSDYHTGVFQPMAIIAALMRRAQEGKTVTMESSIFRSGAVTAGPAILDYQLNNRLPERRDNRDASAAPHGVYQCQGDDRYCVISVDGDEQWTVFRQALGNPDWTQDARFATAFSRLSNQDELDRLVGEWTVQLTAEEAMDKLQQAGVPASIVSQGQDLHDSEHLKARDFYRDTNYYVAERGTHASQWEEGSSISWSMPFSMSKTPVEFGKYTNIGEDNSYVFGELLGLSPEEIVRLSEKEVIY